jgi:hypothetical protein
MVLRTSDAVTQAGGVQLTFFSVVVLYSGLGLACLLTLRTLARRWAIADQTAGGRDFRSGGPRSAIPYGPPDVESDE